MCDDLGSTRLPTAYPSPSIRECDDYLPFGESLPCGNTDGSTVKFTGLQRDSESNLDHTQFRQYSSSLGRWMSPDPAGLAAVDPTNPQSWNRYHYALNNPTNYIDPTGLNDCPDQKSTCGDDWTDPWSGAPGVDLFGDPVAGTAGDPVATVGNDCMGGPCFPFMYFLENGCVVYVSYYVVTGAGGQYQTPEISTLCPGGGQGGGGHVGGGGNGAPRKPWYKSCTAKAIGNGLLHAGIDGIGLIPEGGLISRAVGNYAGYRGIVATQQGTKALQAGKMATAIGSTGVNSDDTSGLGLTSTALGVTGIVTTLAGATPVVGQLLSGASIVLDAVAATKDIAKCN